MKPDYILLRLGELTLKGRNRSVFENRVLTQLRDFLKSYPNIQIIKNYGRVYIQLNGEPFKDIAEQLKKIFGLVSFSPVNKVDTELEAMRKVSLELMNNVSPKPKTFKVSVRRAYKHFPHDSQELNHLIGGYVLHHTPGLKVNVHEPDVILKVEVREEGTFIYSEIIPGLGGFPLGSSGKSMLMLSGGIDSPVAGYLAMKRGMKLEAVHFHSAPFTSERAKQKVIDLAKELTNYSGKMKVHIVPFTEIQTKFNEHPRKNLIITFMRRAMLRITEKLAEKNGNLGIITGDNLGQVASQTLSSLNVIGRATSMPILRPLITMDKNEIIRIAEDINTFDISILPYEDCCTIFLPKNPSTNPNLGVVERIEETMEWLPQSIEDAVENTETIIVSKQEEEKLSHLF
ncbi:tRNA uracil 4-sulfurtransferase ThiI [Chengkuizengella axinellae]|uniref:Probable tRNA sulfurtransferase n=1 Tax=Chengkuizengella axinellae TaxID=3064388 RepID=A0ABT9IUS3_9BACL|nr:tRNA uracil 4-sulfurtransferase ThiI [Chengkuizengella sp. 2205SS18-9]MDP5273115.1 tRNA uracil 4-sulfurtransferase ThiI [Chengkuizengella sp. 2205SS18-9]